MELLHLKIYDVEFFQNESYYILLNGGIKYGTLL